jgi:hypothetical protein
MATQNLTATLVPAAEAATTSNLVNLTTGVTVITPGNTAAFPNFPGQTLLFIAVGGTGGTIQLNVGTTIFGQSFAAFSVITLTLSSNYVLGAFHSALELPNSNTVTVTTSGALVSSMAVLQLAGVY